MASLKDLKASIVSVQSTKRITSAMKMVAAAKLKRATDSVQASRPYAENMGRILDGLAQGSHSTHPLMVGTGKSDIHLLVVVSSDRGLCGGFNGNLIRSVVKHAQSLMTQGKTVKVVPIGRKATVGLRSALGQFYIETFEELNKPAPAYANAETVSEMVLKLSNAQDFDVCTLFYNRFISTLEQKPTAQQIIPLGSGSSTATATTSGAVYEHEPSEDAILNALLPKNVTVQLYSAMMESFAGEQAARMTAMDNATTNATDLIKSLSNTYNRSRQAQITKELIEIISGAEAL